ncbi:Rieske (2Fe-2S) protein [Streptomyces sp. NPDC020489]|uniref:Rieske (2Fe-2S) protein n=1 Tax=Streptomyces sp. NPDC020489 TaxID=3365077 RepID=UPI0037A2160E
MTTQGPTRRSVLLASGAAAFAVGCAEYGGEGDGDTGSDTVEASAGTELARTGEIPVGGGKIFKDEKVVVTQPKEGEFKAFTNICTHQQCPVANVDGGTINCTCHGSRFSITDGSVTNPPATQPLAEKKITVKGDSIRLA